jgi:hypothetical protein
MIEVLIAPLTLGELIFRLVPEPWSAVRLPDVFVAPEHARHPLIQIHWLDLAANHRPAA